VLFGVLSAVHAQAQDEKQLEEINRVDSIAAYHESIPAYDSALVYYRKELKLYERYKNDKEIGRTYLKIGRMLSEQGNVAEASDVFFKMLHYAEKSNDTVRIAIAHTRIGRCYEFLEQPDKAIAQYKLGLEISERFSIHKQMIALYGALGNMYLQQQKLEECKELVHRADSVAAILENPYFSYGANNLSGLYYLASGDFKLAEKYMKMALDYNLEKNPNSSHTAGTYFNLGDIYAKQKNIPKSIQHYEKAYEIFLQQNEKKNIMDISLNLSNLYADLNDFRKAYQYLHTFNRYADSVRNEDVQRTIAELQTQYDVARKDAQIQVMDRENKLIAKEKELKAQQAETAERNFYFSIGLAVLLLLVILVVILFFVHRQRVNRQLSEQAVQLTKLQAQMNPHLIFNALVSIQEMILRDDKVKAVQSVSRFSKLMRSTLNNSEHPLIPLETEIEFLHTYVAFEQERSLYPVAFSVNTDEALTKNGAMLSPMLIQPLVENAFKHAFSGSTIQASIEIDFSLRQEQGVSVLVAVVRDNGKGMEGSLSSQSKALTILKQRLQYIWKSNSKKEISDAMRVSSASGKGTNITLILPLIAE
jgi:tetratricopeptide (TPR) repeat protein